MLALKSSITTAVNGWTSFRKKVISWGLPLSRMVNWSRSRSGTSRPWASVTVVKIGTIRVPERKVACWAIPAAAASMTRSRGHQEAHTRELSNRRPVTAVPPSNSAKISASCASQLPLFLLLSAAVSAARPSRACRAWCATSPGRSSPAPSVLVIAARPACKPRRSPAPTAASASTRDGRPERRSSCAPAVSPERSQPLTPNGPLDIVLAPAGALRVGHRHADPHRAAARRRAGQRQRRRQGADSPVAGHRRRRRAAPGADLQPVPPDQQPVRRIRPRRACRCAASARAASAGRWC